MDALEVLQSFAERLERGDADGVAALFTPDATYQEPPVYAFSGRDAIRAFVADFAARHIEVSFTIRRSFADAAGTQLAAEWRFAYMRTADAMQRVFEGISMVELRGGLIASWRGYSTLVQPHTN
jgi:limonene-1,2-epoxide hydrolase